MVFSSYEKKLIPIFQMRKLNPRKKLGEFLKGKFINRYRTSSTQCRISGSQAPQSFCLIFFFKVSHSGIAHSLLGCLVSVHTNSPKTLAWELKWLDK